MKLFGQNSCIDVRTSLLYHAFKTASKLLHRYLKTPFRKHKDDLKTLSRQYQEYFKITAKRRSKMSSPRFIDAKDSNMESKLEKPYKC